LKLTFSTLMWRDIFVIFSRITMLAEACTGPIDSAYWYMFCNLVVLSVSLSVCWLHRVSCKNG